MNIQEFKERTELEVTDKQFDKINEIYMSTQLDKDGFCADYKKHSDSIIIEQLGDEIDMLNRHIKSESAKDAIEKKNLQEYHQNLGKIMVQKSMIGGDEDLVTLAVELLGGAKAYLRYKIENDIAMLEIDKKMLMCALV